MDRNEKERVVDELADRLRSAESLIVADYRGLTNAQLADLRVELIGHGARFVVVKNTLTRRAAEAAGADGLLALLEGPTAIAFVEADGDPAAVAKALAKSSKDTKILSLRGGVLSGQAMSGEDIERLATLPPLDVLQAQVVGVIVAPLTQLAAVLNAPLQNLVGLIDARIDQLGGADADASASAADEPGAAAEEAEAGGEGAGSAGAPADTGDAETAEDGAGAQPEELADAADAAGTPETGDIDSNDDHAGDAGAGSADEEE